MSKLLQGHCADGEKQFAIINTTNYNGDGNWAITPAKIDQLEELGFDECEILEISNLKVGGIWQNSIYGLDTQVIRLG